jgi:hypothetical protein
MRTSNSDKTREPPAQPPSLREAMRMVATLGGFLGRTGDGEPGAKSLWLGSQYLDVMIAMWKILEDVPHSPLCPAEDMSKDQLPRTGCNWVEIWGHIGDKKWANGMTGSC